MVVTRRAPPAPVPTSRTNSSQPIPRVKGRVPAAGTPEAHSPLANGVSRTAAEANEVSKAQLDDTDSPSKKGKGKGKGRDKKWKNKSRKRGGGFLDLLTRVFLLWFTIYTLSVCPTDESLKSPVCRGLHHYRKYVLEPYILPPLQHALSHPAVAPYVERVQPYVDRSITIAKPIALRTQKEWTERVVPQWNQRVVPQWEKRVIPQWNKHVVPQYKQHLEPYVAKAEQQVGPYLYQLQNTYEEKIVPQLRVVAVQLHRWQHQARPYVILAAHKTYDGYQRAKPYAIPVLQKLQLLLIQFAQFLGEQRRQFVDPHVKKIWERVNELGNGEATTPLAQVRSTVSASVSQASASVHSFVSSVVASSSSITPPAASEAVVGSASSVLPDVVSESESLPAVIPTTNPVATLKEYLPSASSAASVASSAAEHVVSEASVAASSVTEQVASSASSIASVASSVVVDDAVPSASSVVEESVVSPIASVTAQAASLASSLSDEASSTISHVSASIASAVPEVLSTASSVVEEAAGTVASSVSSVIPTAAASGDDDDDLDLARIFADLGLEENFLETRSEASESAHAAVETETAEEKAEKQRLRQLETAQKRADITGRHAKWEAEMEERMKANSKALRHALVTMRKAATAELKESQEIRKEVEDLVDEAEKYLKGAEKYLANLRKESRSPDEKKSIWERVVEKLDKKFEERLMQTEGVVNGWYLRNVETELAEVRRLASEVKDIADRAQVDIGLDYAWLDDVTYDDWQRYHAMDRNSEAFFHNLLSIQNGSHPSPPVNPVILAIEDLQNEVQDIVVGFETRLRRIKRNGERAFGATPDEPDAHEPREDETVSILPIEDDAHKGMEEGESPAAPPVVIGRTPEEIISALDRAAEHEAHATSAPEDKSKDPEQVLSSLVEEAVAEEVPTASSRPHHAEL